MKATAPAAAPEPGLPDWAAGRLAAFERHLTAGRGLSAHTVRAYLGDVGALLEHAGAWGGVPRLGARLGDGGGGGRRGSHAGRPGRGPPGVHRPRVLARVAGQR